MRLRGSGVGRLSMPCASAVATATAASGEFGKVPSAINLRRRVHHARAWRLPLPLVVTPLYLPVLELRLTARLPMGDAVSTTLRPIDESAEGG